MLNCVDVRTAKVFRQSSDGGRAKKNTHSCSLGGEGRRHFSELLIDASCPPRADLAAAVSAAGAGPGQAQRVFFCPRLAPRPRSGGGGGGGGGGGQVTQGRRLWEPCSWPCPWPWKGRAGGVWPWAGLGSSALAFIPPPPWEGNFQHTSSSSLGLSFSTYQM
jgi:hypothetical protein